MASANSPASIRRRQIDEAEAASIGLRRPMPAVITPAVRPARSANRMMSSMRAEIDAERADAEKRRSIATRAKIYPYKPKSGLSSGNPHAGRYAGLKRGY